MKKSYIIKVEFDEKIDSLELKKEIDKALGGVKKKRNVKTTNISSYTLSY